MMPTKTAIIPQVPAGSFLRVIVYACHTWWYQRVFFGVAGAFASLLLRAMVASLLAWGGRPHANGGRPGMPTGGQRASRLAASWRAVVGSPRCASAAGI